MMGLNLLILLSILLLPALLSASIYNVTWVASSIKIANPTQTLNGAKVTVSTVLTIRNMGPFPIEAGLTASIRGDLGTWVGVTAPKLSIPADSQLRSIPVSVEIDLSAVSEDDAKRLAFSPENFTVTVSATVSMLPIVSLGAEASAKATWLPPLHNFTIGTPLVAEVNPTQIKFEVPISFENQSPFFALRGNGIIRLFDSNDQYVGEGTITVSAQPRTEWSGSAPIMVTAPMDLGDLLLNDAVLKYRADLEFTLTDYNMMMKALSQGIELEWGAPIKNPHAQTSLTPVNSTHTRITGALSFTNGNRFLTLDGAITPKLVNGAGETWAGKTQQIRVVPGSAVSLTIGVVVPNSQLLGGLRIVLGYKTKTLSFDLEVGPLG